MRRKLPLFVMVGVAGVLVPVLAVLAQSSSPTCPSACCSQGFCRTSKSSAPSASDAKIIDELVAILKETKSARTFFVTAMALGRMGPEAKRALPQLIRNAERLELFEAKADSGGEGVLAAIIMLAATNKDAQPTGYYPATLMSCANGPYGSSSMGSSDWNQPAVAPSACVLCPTAAAPCPVTSIPVTPGTASAPVYAPTPAAPQPTPLPAVKKPSSKGGKSRPPVASPPYTR